MAAGDPIEGLDDLILLCTGGGGGAPESISFYKDALINGAAPAATLLGRRTSLWQYQGQPGANPTAPTTSTALTNATAGSLKQTTPGSGKKKRLLSLVAAALNAGQLILYDRLNHSGGLSGTATGAQTTNLPTAALTRYTTGVGVEPWLEIWTQIGASTTTVTASYTDDENNSGQTTIATSWGNTNFREAQRIVILPIAAGDRGVRAVASVTNAASTGTAGDFGVVLAKPLVNLPLTVAGCGSLQSAILHWGGPLDLGTDSDACLAFAWVPNTTTAPQVWGMANFVEK